MTYIFYDTETTGKSTSFDQILQFAAIRTDDDLNVLDTFDVRCRLLPYVVPSPGALLVTGTTIAAITTCPLSHFEMMRRIHAKMHRWSEGGAVFVGWNSMKFDETLLRQAYYQTLLPVYQTNTNGNGRADMMRMASFGWPGTQTGDWRLSVSCKGFTTRVQKLPGRTRDPAGTRPNL